MTYGLILCGLCKRPRVIDLSNKVTTCPYCGYEERTAKGQIVFQSDSQSEVRKAMSKGLGADELIPTRMEIAAQKRRIEESDPYSTMVYRYEHAGDIDEKMSILSEGLTRIKGEFTLDDMMDVDPKKAEKLLSAMIDRGFVYETRPGFYKARSQNDINRPHHGGRHGSKLTWGCRYACYPPYGGPHALSREASSSL